VVLHPDPNNPGILSGGESTTPRDLYRKGAYALNNFPCLVHDCLNTIRLYLTEELEGEVNTLWPNPTYPPFTLL
jgi:hypothetical protein